MRDFQKLKLFKLVHVACRYSGADTEDEVLYAMLVGACLINHKS